MSTPFAFNADIHAHSNNFPAICSARMRLFHFNDVVQIKFFIKQRNPAFLRLFKHLISSFFAPVPLPLGDYKGQGAETVSRFHAHLIEVLFPCVTPGQ